MLNWLGGMGIIVLAVAILPMLGVGGTQLFKAEIPGMDKKARWHRAFRRWQKALVLLYDDDDGGFFDAAFCRDELV